MGFSTSTMRSTVVELRRVFVLFCFSFCTVDDEIERALAVAVRPQIVLASAVVFVTQRPLWTSKAWARKARWFVG